MIYDGVLMKIAFRTDASCQIGTGHLMRCLALADALKSRGASTHFICRHIFAHHAELLDQRNHSVAQLSGDRLPKAADELTHSHWLGASQLQDARDTLEALAGEFWDWLVVDHYALDARWESIIRQSAAHILVIDDLADRLHECDALLDQNLHANMETRYTGKAPQDCRLMLGPRYALLRDEFLRLRAYVQPRTGPLEQVLVFLGGVDADDITSKALQALVHLSRPEIRIEVVIGTHHPARGSIEKTCRQNGYRYHVETACMAELMVQADLAIGSAGSATWERCCLGLPTLCVTIANNQISIAKALAMRGVVINLGDGRQLSVPALLRALSRMINNPEELTEFSNRGMSLVDGCGVQRVTEMIWSIA